MIADPVELLTCDLTRDGLTGAYTLTVRVPRLGAKRRKGGRYAARDAVTVYTVRVTPRFVFLSKKGGAVYTVAKAGGCSCGDSTYRGRPGGCKHRAAVEAVSLLQA